MPGESLRRRRLLLPIVASVVALVAAACGASSSPSPSSAASLPVASSAAPAASSAAPSTGASASAAESPAQSSGTSSVPSVALPSFHEAPDLEAQLPDQVGTETLQKLSFSGASVLNNPAGQTAPQIQQALGALGKSVNDVSIAIAGSSSVQIGAYRVAGVDGNTLLGLIQQAMAQGGSAMTMTDANVGGKSVKVGTESGSGTTEYFYAHGDVLFFVTADTDALVNEALSKLP